MQENWNIACLATMFNETYTAKPSDVQAVRQALHVLHEIMNFY